MQKRGSILARVYANIPDKKTSDDDVPWHVFKEWETANKLNGVKVLLEHKEDPVVGQVDQLVLNERSKEAFVSITLSDQHKEDVLSRIKAGDLKDVSLHHRWIERSVEGRTVVDHDPVEVSICKDGWRELTHIVLASAESKETKETHAFNRVESGLYEGLIATPFKTTLSKSTPMEKQPTKKETTALALSDDSDGGEDGFAQLRNKLTLVKARAVLKEQRETKRQQEEERKRADAERIAKLESALSTLTSEFSKLAETMKPAASAPPQSTEPVQPPAASQPVAAVVPEPAQVPQQQPEIVQPPTEPPAPADAAPPAQASPPTEEKKAKVYEEPEAVSTQEPTPVSSQPQGQPPAQMEVIGQAEEEKKTEKHGLEQQGGQSKRQRTVSDLARDMSQIASLLPEGQQQSATQAMLELLDVAQQAEKVTRQRQEQLFKQLVVAFRDSNKCSETAAVEMARKFEHQLFHEPEAVEAMIRSMTSATAARQTQEPVPKQDSIGRGFERFMQSQGMPRQGAVMASQSAHGQRPVSSLWSGSASSADPLQTAVAQWRERNRRSKTEAVEPIFLYQP